MADWFKFYNDGLDAAEFQWCLSEQPLVTSVWLAILSEASKKRRASFKWKDDDFELLGMARKINVSPPVFNQCLDLLQRVGYIVKENGCIEIPGWEKRQSDYARGLDRGYYAKDPTNDHPKHHTKTSKKSVEASNILASVSQVSSVRGEERRVEENKDSLPAPQAPDPVGEEIGSIEEAWGSSSPKPPENPETKPATLNRIDSKHSELIALWCEAWDRTFDHKYVFKAAKDGTAVRNLLKTGLSPAEIIRVAKIAWSKFSVIPVCKFSMEISTFASQFNAIKASVEDKHGMQPRWKVQQDKRARLEVLTGKVPETRTPAEIAEIKRLRAELVEIESEMAAKTVL